MNKTEQALKPCPFCGGDAELLLDADNCPFATCPYCQIEMPAYRPGFEHMAIAAWNRRALSQSEAHAEQPEMIVSAQSLDDQRRMDQKFTLLELVGNLQCMVRNSQAAFDGFGPEWVSDLAKQSVELLEEYSDTLRSLACSLSAGGWNSEGLIHPKIADDKIRWGIDYLLQAAKRDVLTQAPQERAAVTLTDEQIGDIWLSLRKYHGGETFKVGHLEFAKRVINLAQSS